MDSNLLLCLVRIYAYLLESAVPPLVVRVLKSLPPNHEVAYCVLELMFGVIVTHDNAAVFPNIMGGFAIIHSTVKK
jgi:hypothetical protein